MKEWLEELKKEIVSLFHHLDLYRKLSTIIDDNKHFANMDKTLLIWMRKAFIVDLVVGIGRICDESRNSRSFVRFLRECSEVRADITKEKYLKRFKNFNPDKVVTQHILDSQNKYFDELVGDKSGKLTQKSIETDILKLTKGNPCKKIIDFRNQYIAHIGKEKDMIPSLEELLNAFKVIEKIGQKYDLLLNGSYGDFTPTMQGGWSQVLTVPWLGIDVITEPL